MSDVAAIAVITLMVGATQVGAALYLAWLADRRGLARTHAVWGLAGVPGLLLGALGIMWFSRRKTGQAPPDVP